ncbi:ankyrin repeat domain-containing protein [Chryseobacterium sp. 3008163]|nr:ankyrin repeat domain-containing protein [Chryseobacterium sp. 3008163]
MRMNTNCKKKNVLLYALILSLYACQSIPDSKKTTNSKIAEDAVSKTEEISFAQVKISPLNREMLDAAAQGNLKKLEEAINKGADINVRGNGYATALMNASLSNHPEVVSFLLKKGALINAQDEVGEAALTRSVSSQNNEILNILLHAGANINLENKKGISLLEYAISDRNYPVILTLLDHKIDVKSKDESTYLLKLADWGTAVGVAGLNGREIHPSDKEEIKIMQKLIDMGVNVNQQNKKGWTALMVSVESAPLSIVQFLLDKGANVNSKDNLGWTALDWAKNAGREDIHQLLLKYEGKAGK